ncbi:MAG: glycosyltransferase [Dysgonamonadaceae bacterium]|jgi:glycosyltransferase involved in cell wall biosynthesis|nr:glycosyltransferase [Dysgonamonadaceae bacterium]
MTKILHIPNYYPPHIGGIEDVCHNIVAGLPEIRHIVICFNDKTKTEDSLYEGIRIVRCGVWKKLFRQSVSLTFLKELKNILDEYKPDIVHFHTPNPLISLYLLMTIPENVKLVLHWHSDIVEQGFLYEFYRPIEKRLLRRADRILTTSATYIDGSRPLLSWKNKLQIIPNTVNVSKLIPKKEDLTRIEKIREKYGYRKILFTFGRHVHYKGLLYLLEAVPKISEDAVVVVAGKGPLSEKLETSCNAPNVYFPGILSDDELRCYLYASDIFLFPSITRNEAFGIALAEAMYCGLPAVTFTIPASGVNWVSINGKTGIEVENRNSQAFAEAIDCLLADEKLRRTMGENAACRAREFFLTEVIKGDLMELYDHLNERQKNL